MVREIRELKASGFSILSIAAKFKGEPKHDRASGEWEDLGRAEGRLAQEISAMEAEVAALIADGRND